MMLISAVRSMIIVDIVPSGYSKSGQHTIVSADCTVFITGESLLYGSELTTANKHFEPEDKRVKVKSQNAKIFQKIIQ